MARWTKAWQASWHSCTDLPTGVAECCTCAYVITLALHPSSSQQRSGRMFLFDGEEAERSGLQCNRSYNEICRDLKLFLSLSQTFVEELVRLPKCFLCYTPAVDAPPVAPLPAAASGFVTFGSFNNLAKITPEVRCMPHALRPEESALQCIPSLTVRCEAW